MKIVKELALYIVMLVVIIMLGSLWNVSTAKELSSTNNSNDALISDIDLEITQMRSELLREEILNSGVSHESVVNSAISDLSKENESDKSLILLEIEKVKNEEKLQAEKKAQLEAKRKARLEAERKARLEVEKKARLEAEKNNLANEQVNSKSTSNYRSATKQQIKKAEVQQQTFYMETSAYTSKCNGCTGITSSGFDIRNTIYYKGYRVIAADTNVLPFGTLVEIEGIGKAVVLDRGGAIKGNKIDILVNNKNEAYSYGRKHNVKITVLGKISY